MNDQPWYPFALRGIDYAVSRGKKLTVWESEFLETARKRISYSLGLSDKQEAQLRKLHGSLTNLPAVRI